MQKPKKLPRDPNARAARIVALSIGEQIPEPEAPIGTRNPAAVALGRLGGLKGGKARAASLSKERRREIAREAAKARWTPKPET